MNHNRKSLNVVLSGVIFLLFVIPILANAETNVIPNQNLPDLVVKEITCGSGNKLYFSVSNIGAALPSGWKAVANVYFDGANMGSVDLGGPTSGDLTLSGGAASYLVAFDIARTMEVKVVVDSTNSIAESNEGNNILAIKVSPCAATPVQTTPAPTTPKPTTPVQTTPTQTTTQLNFPDMVVKEIKCSQGKLYFTAANIGGPMPAGWWSNAAVKFDGVHMGNIALQNPTTGDLTPSGGFATYLTDFDITRTVKVEISVDASASVTELNEGNNYMYSPVEPCGAAITTTTVTTKDKLPDLVVKEITCGSGNYLLVKVANIGGPISSSGEIIATVNFDGVFKGGFILGKPTSGDLTPAGGVATYLTNLYIANPAKVEVSLDTSNAIQETNEGNNYMYAPVEQCEVNIEGCIKKYMDVYGITYDEAKKRCTAETQVTPTIGGGCIEKYMQVFGITYEEAKKRCTAETQVTPTTGGGCIEKYMDVFKISYDEAKKRCESETAQARTVTKTAIDRCGEVEKKLSILIDKLNNAQGKDVEALKKEIEVLKIELKSCEAKVPQVTKEVTNIKNPCDEVKMLKESLEQLAKKISYIKELIAKGELNESDLKPYSSEYYQLTNRLEKMNFACQQGKPVEESPCARLSKLEMIYKEINDKLQSTQDEKSKLELNEKLASVVKEINSLKQRCGAENLGAEKVESLYDIEKAYRSKQRIIVEGTSENDMQTELAKIESEKNKLIEEYALRLAELDARQSTIIKKIQIKGGELILDDLKTKANKVKVEIKDKDIEIETTKSGAEITDGDTKVKGDIPLEYTDGALKSGKSGKEIKVLPSAIIKGIEGKDYVMVDDEPTWLPITIIFKPTELAPQPDPPGVTLPEGTKAEKLGAGHFRFTAPGGMIVEIEDYDRKTGEIGYLAIINPDPPLKPVSDMKGSLKSAPKPEKAKGALPPSVIRELKLIDEGKPEYVADVKKTGKLLGFITTDMDMEYRISAETGEAAGTSAPWWGVFVFGTDKSFTDVPDNTTNISVVAAELRPLRVNRTPIAPHIPTAVAWRGTVGTSYNFSTTTRDAEGDEIYYVFDWGDGRMESTGYSSPSGETVTLSHRWSRPGNYSVRAKAVDLPHATIGTETFSEWSGLYLMAIYDRINLSDNRLPIAPRRPTAIAWRGTVGTSYNFSTKSIDAEGDEIYYVFDWGDGRMESTGYSSPSGETVTLSHSWFRPGNYSVRAKAVDLPHATIGTETFSGWSLPYTITIYNSLNWSDNELPAAPIRPISTAFESRGTVRTSYNFSTMTTDAEGDWIYYVFDWGDGRTESLRGRFLSGELATLSHSWLRPGTYYVRVKAVDLPHASYSNATYSAWSVPYAMRVYEE